MDVKAQEFQAMRAEQTRVAVEKAAAMPINQAEYDVEYKRTIEQLIASGITDAGLMLKEYQLAKDYYESQVSNGFLGINPAYISRAKTAGLAKVNAYKDHYTTVNTQQRLRGEAEWYKRDRSKFGSPNPFLQYTREELAKIRAKVNFAINNKDEEINTVDFTTKLVQLEAAEKQINSTTDRVVPTTVVLPPSSSTSTPSTGTSPLTIAAIGFGVLKLLAII